MRVDRDLLLKEIVSVSPGLSMKADCLQSGDFIFKDGMLGTFNEETACRRPSLLNFTCAVAAVPMIQLLTQMKESEIDVEMNGSNLIVKGKNKEAGIKLDKTIESPIESVEDPGKFKKLHPEFLQAIGKVHQSASEDTSQFNLTCLNIAPEWIEACDNWRLTRYKIETGFDSSLLVKEKSIKHIVGLGPTKFSVTSSFVHFKRPDGLVISCRKYIEDYPDLTDFLKTKGTKWMIPKGLKDAAEKGKIFTGENQNANHLKVTLSPGKVIIKAEGENGYYKEGKKLEYKGERLIFKISPKMLIELVDEHNEVLLSDTKIKVNGDKFEFVAALETTEEPNDSTRQETED